MATKDYLKSKLKEFEESGHFGRDKDEKRLANAYMGRARHNLVVMSNSLKISTLEKAKKILELPGKYTQFDWAVIQGYYAMYMSVLACLAKMGLKSRNHTATSLALELFFVHKGLLERKYLDMMNKIIDTSLEEKFIVIKKKRKTAQYDAGTFIQKKEATKVNTGAMEFVDRMGKLFNELKK